MTETKRKIFIAGHNGMVGSAILRELSKTPLNKFLQLNLSQLDLTNQKDVMSFFRKNNISQVYLLLQKLEEFMQIIIILRNLYIKT